MANLGFCDYCSKTVVDGDAAVEDEDVLVHADCYDKWNAQ